MEIIPKKITVRLDFTSREMLHKHLLRKINMTASQVLRRALRRYLEEEQAKYVSDGQAVPSGEGPGSDVAKIFKTRGVKS